jgi:hypothetical protein
MILRRYSLTQAVLNLESTDPGGLWIDFRGFKNLDGKNYKFIFTKP